MSGNGDEDLTGSAEQLRDEVTRLAGYLDKFEQRVGAGQNRVNTGVERNRKLMIGVIASIVLDLVLTVAVGWNAYRIDEVQERTSSEVLCPLYDLFLEQYHPERQPAEKLPEYENTFNVIRKSYDVLGCR